MYLLTEVARLANCQSPGSSGEFLLQVLFCLSNLGVIWSVLPLLCLFFLFHSASYHWFIIQLSFPFLLCCLAVFHFSSTYAMFLSQFLPLLFCQSAFLLYTSFLSLFSDLSAQLFPDQHLSLNSFIFLSISKTFCPGVYGQPVTILSSLLFHRNFSSHFSHFPPSLILCPRPVIFSCMIFLFHLPFQSHFLLTLCLPFSTCPLSLVQFCSPLSATV